MHKSEKPLAIHEELVMTMIHVIRNIKVMLDRDLAEVFTKMRALLSTQKEILQKLEQLEQKDIVQDE